MKQRTILVTGATDGIGKETATSLAQMGHYVLLHGRSAERGEKVLAEIFAKSGMRNGEYYCADFSSMKAVQAMACEIMERHESLDILINNAGVFMENRVMTAEGFEMTFAVNHLAPFLLTHHLLDHLKQASPSRIINVSSTSHWSASPDWQNMQGEKHFEGHGAYSFSKLANILFTFELAERLKGSGVTANSLDPGNIDTKMLRSGWPGIRGDTLAAGARTILYLATSPDVEGVTGAYFEDCAPVTPSHAARDRETGRRLWQVSEILAGF